MGETLERLFLREKPAQALLAVAEIEPAYAALVAKRIDSTFPHTSSILSQLEGQGLISSRAEGRVRYLELTDRGKKVAGALRNLCDLLQRPDEHWTRLERLRQAMQAASSPGQNASANALKIGPLRRDLAVMRGQDDEMLRAAAEELDGQIMTALRI
ncbi:MAG: hypothetical protein A4E48_00708 [Methanosaeta sp. PtaU1.Bin060]|jgi:DNA-binding PadR family transcriptional regulator|nr:MAG: hypothetical protein A4E48_00708 [Methanosaeta sp. PtaU1.Bin060]